VWEATIPEHEVEVTAIMRNIKRSLLFAALAAVVCSVLGLSTTAIAQTPQTSKSRAALSGNAATAEQPLYAEYKGVRLGMTDKEVRAKLGVPAMSDNELDLFVFSDNETAQINYDAARKVNTISIDYANGVGAPDYKAVVGADLQPRNGSLYRMVRYESLGFWVSYNRTGGPVVIVTVTIQKM
jgi:hypothetical protein